MNLLLFYPDELNTPLSGKDSRAVHIREILKSQSQDTLEAGVIDGLRGKATIKEILPDGSYSFEFDLTEEPAPLCPLTLIIGIPRPPTARRLLRDLTASGVRRILFSATDLGEKSYLTSHLWNREEYKEAVFQGMAQGESTLMPEIGKYYSLYKCIDQIAENVDLLALDNINPDVPLKKYNPHHAECCLAIGPERGWSDREREILRQRGFQICSLGERVLRTETAAHMGTALIQALQNYI